MTRKSLSIGIVLSLLATGLCNAQVVDVSLDTTSMDRWNYPFNGSPGSRLTASTFGAVELEGFDDRDAQLVLGFDTSALIPAGMDISLYDIISVRVTITNSNGDTFRYDPSYDTHDTYLFLDDSLDADMGRPMELYGVGYRNGFDQSTWGEFTVFGGTAVVEPVQGARHAFACDFPDGVSPRDISNNLKDEFDPTPMAIGQADTVVPGEIVPADTDFVFDVDVCSDANQSYISESLALGELRFSVSSLSPADGGPGGGNGEIQYPFWYTRENAVAQILGFTPRLEIRVRLGGLADYNADGTQNLQDIFAYLNDFNAGTEDADLNHDCQLNLQDIFTLLAAFNS
ncbi:MAG: hypothetical protein JKY96_05605 [Phycisphaerales bacterium]|nr:hypothetical protein [Phycisphaerales bacterium]